MLYDNHVRIVIAAEQPISNLVSHENRSLAEMIAANRQLIDDLQLNMVSDLMIGCGAIANQKEHA